MGQLGSETVYCTHAAPHQFAQLKMRTALEDHGITYSENVIPFHQADFSVEESQALRLPGHVQSTRQALLSKFSPRIPESERFFFEWEAGQYGTASTGQMNIALPPESAYSCFPETQEKISRLEWETDYDNIDNYKSLAGDARALTEFGASETAWKNLHKDYLKTIFRYPMDRIDDTMGGLYLEDNIPWNDAGKHRKKDPLPYPIPGLTFGFPISNKASHNEPLARNFSVEVLGPLRKNGLVSSPISGLQRLTKYPSYQMSAIELVCFPWALVEYSYDGSQQDQIEECYCRAANSASAALTLFDNLYQRSGLLSTNRTPPVIAFTLNMSELRVWLAYSCYQEDGPTLHKMMCIRASQLDSAWGIMAAQQIVSNMLSWAARVLRPQIAECISWILCRPKWAELPIRERSTAAKIPSHGDKNNEESSSQRDGTSPLLPQQWLGAAARNLLGVSKLAEAKFDVLHYPYFVYRTSERYESWMVDAMWEQSDGEDKDWRDKDWKDDGSEQYIPSSYDSGDQSFVSGGESGPKLLEGGISGEVPLGSDEDQAFSDSDYDEGSGMFSSCGAEVGAADIFRKSPDAGSFVSTVNRILNNPYGSLRYLEESDVDDLLSRAFLYLDGRGFVALHAVHYTICALDGISLLDATWTALEVWRYGEISEEDRIVIDTHELRLNEVLDHINNALCYKMCVHDWIKPSEIIAGERWDEVDQALQFIQRSGDGDLRKVLAKALEALRPVMRLPILEKIAVLSTEEVVRMKREALFLQWRGPHDVASWRDSAWI
ncbi:hypothetical protein BBP40_011358 [Aspergillus hancockii]|nr:hypothetical protein BBP40_011358 [Aspergillus hancockii]